MISKQRFREDKALSAGFNDLVDSKQFTVAADFAMLEFLERLGSPSDSLCAATAEWKRQGARDFLHILRNLNTEEKPIATTSAKDLTYTHK